MCKSRFIVACGIFVLMLASVSDTCSFLRQKTVRGSRTARSAGIEGRENIYVFRELVSQGMSREKAGALLATPGSSLMCTNTSVPIECSPSFRFRIPSGVCNNLEKPYWGVPFTQLARLIGPEYDDGKESPRGGRESWLPSPRLVSITVHTDLIKPQEGVTNMVVELGQFLAHDLTFAPEDNHVCCGRMSTEEKCFSIPVADDDPFYGPFNQTCISLTRSTPHCMPGPGGVREQMNVPTAFVDGSQIYGYDYTHVDQLREKQGGRFMMNDFYENFSPSKDQITRRHGKEAMHDFLGILMAGDHRCNENPLITALHILFMREHNRLAKEIESAAPNMSDEEIFQNTRRIVTAEWEKIVFAELLPKILGKETMDAYNLTVGMEYTDYDPSIKPSILHSFTTQAFRFGHGLVNGVILGIRKFETVMNFKIRDSFFNNDIITFNKGEGYELLLNGLIQQNSQQADRFMTEDLTNFVQKPPDRDFGDDLAARNIQRGRDHGVPAYDKFREFCKLEPLKDWDHRPEEIEQDGWQKLSQVYKKPQHIDLFTGGLAETPVKGGLVGPTFRCIIAEQLRRVKFGDRFFYTHQNQVASFTPSQLSKISNVTFGDILCANSKLDQTQRDVFSTPSDDNPWIPCDDKRRKVLHATDFL